MITILCSGSRGDFQPYIALAQQLKRLGYPVRISGSSEFKGFIEGYGIECFPLKLGLENVDVDPKLLEAAGSSDNPIKMLLTFNKMKDYGVYMVEDMYKACEGSELIIYHPGCIIGYFAAKEKGIPAVMASPFPMNKTKEYLSVVMYGKAKFNKLNLIMSYKMIQSMLWIASKTSVEAFWKKNKGTKPKGFECPYENVSKEYPAVISCSNFVFRRPQDWNQNIHQCGYWFVEEEKPYVPSQELVDFLEKGEKPIYIGFGSMTILGNHENLLHLILEGLKKSGKRGIISGLHEGQELPDFAFGVKSIPHSWLFPRMAMVCHHGGAGTTAAGFKAGVPCFIIPFSNDQFAWAHRAYDLGVGSYPIYKKDLTADALARGINEACRQEVMDKSKELGECIAKENGAEDIAKVVVKCLKGE